MSFVGRVPVPANHRVLRLCSRTYLHSPPLLPAVYAHTLLPCSFLSGMAVSLAGLGAALSIASSPPLLSAGCLFGFLGLFEIGLGPVMWLLLSELYPLSVRGPAMAMGSTSCWINTVAVTFLFPLLSGAMGMNGVFFMFSGVCVLAMVWLWLFVPETRGKTLEEIEVMLREGRVR